MFVSNGEVARFLDDGVRWLWGNWFTFAWPLEADGTLGNASARRFLIKCFKIHCCIASGCDAIGHRAKLGNNRPASRWRDDPSHHLTRMDISLQTSKYW